MVNAARSDEQERRHSALLGIQKLRFLVEAECGESPEVYVERVEHLNRLVVLHGEASDGYPAEEYGLRLRSYEFFNEVRGFLEDLYFRPVRYHKRWARVYDLDSHGDPVDFLVIQEVRFPR